MQSTGAQSFAVVRAVLRVGLRQALRELWVTGGIRGGRMVGRDAHGNEYYEMLAAPDDRKAQEAGWPVRDTHMPFYRKRYVLPKGGIDEASVVPPEWHGWLHNSVDEHPTETLRFEDTSSGSEQDTGTRLLKESDGTARTIRAWQTPGRPNATGTPQRYVPYSTVRPRVKPYDASASSVQDE